MFPNGNRPGLGQDMRLIAFFHRPNEFLAEPRIRKAKWPHRSTNTSYRMKFIMTKVEVLERRNKRNLPCIDNRVNYDQQAYNDHVKRIGCKPPYLNVHGNYSNCKSKEKMRQTHFNYLFVRRSLTNPCTSLQNINYRYEEIDVKRKAPTFSVEVYLPETFKEIQQVREVNFHTLVGNCGGYVGLFCGMDRICFISFI